MCILISVTKGEMEIFDSKYPNKEAAYNAMVEDIIISTRYNSLEEIKEAAKSGECDISEDGAMAMTNQFGEGLWKIVDTENGGA